MHLKQKDCTHNHATSHFREKEANGNRRKVCSIIRDEVEDALCEVYAARRRKIHANKNTKKIQSRERLNLAYCIYRQWRCFPGAGIMTDYGLDGWGSISSSGKRYFFIPQRPYRLWGPLSNVNRGLFFPCGRGVKLTTCLHLESGSRIKEIYLHSLHMSSCHVVQLIKHRDTFTFYSYRVFLKCNNFFTLEKG
jgi:hypothetical protein